MSESCELRARSTPAKDVQDGTATVARPDGNTRRHPPHSPMSAIQYSASRPQLALKLPDPSASHPEQLAGS